LLRFSMALSSLFLNSSLMDNSLAINHFGLLYQRKIYSKLKFGLKISGEAGIPILTKASAESNFEIEVKCKFPPKPTIPLKVN